MSPITGRGTETVFGAGHQEAFTWSDYWPSFLSSTLENWQSEWLQLVFQAILLLGAKHWLFQVDAEDLERMERKLDRIEEHLGLDPQRWQEPAPEREDG